MSHNSTPPEWSSLCKIKKYTSAISFAPSCQVPKCRFHFIKTSLLLPYWLGFFFVCLLCDILKRDHHKWCRGGLLPVVSSFVWRPSRTAERRIRLKITPFQFNHQHCVIARLYVLISWNICWYLSLLAHEQMLLSDYSDVPQAHFVLCQSFFKFYF